MHFLVTFTDRPASAKARAAARPAHLDHLKANLDRIRIAGPILGDDHETIAGAIWIVEADDEAEVQRLVDADPNHQAGIFASVTIKPWRWVIGAPPQD